MFHSYRLPIFTILLLFIVVKGHGYAVKGILDLRLESFEQPIPLEGQWEIYWGELKAPNSLFDGENYAVFPHLWKGQLIGEDTLQAQGYATYRLKVILPNSTNDYELFIEDMYCAYSLYVDGKLVASNGEVGDSDSTSTPEWRPLMVELGQKSGIIELVLNVSNWQHSKGGANNPIMLSKAGQISSSFHFFTVFQTLLLLAFLAVSLFFLYRFVFITYDWASFFYALFLIVYSYRLVGADTYLLHQWFPDFPWIVAVRIEYFSLFGSTLFFALFVYQLYKERVSYYLLLPLIVLCTGSSLAAFISSPLFFTKLLLPFFAVIVIYMIYGFYMFTTSVINNELGSLYGVISAAVVFTSFVYQMLYYIRWLEYEYLLTWVAHVLFLIFQSIYLYKQARASL